MKPREAIDFEGRLKEKAPDLPLDIVRIIMNNAEQFYTINATDPGEREAVIDGLVRESAVEARLLLSQASSQKLTEEQTLRYLDNGVQRYLQNSK